MQAALCHNADGGLPEDSRLLDGNGPLRAGHTAFFFR